MIDVMRETDLLPDDVAKEVPEVDYDLCSGEICSTLLLVDCSAALDR
jgi:hypothetical protein